MHPLPAPRLNFIIVKVLCWDTQSLSCCTGVSPFGCTSCCYLRGSHPLGAQFVAIYMGLALWLHSLSLFTWVSPSGCTSCRYLHGSRPLGAQVVAIYVGFALWVHNLSLFSYLVVNSAWCMRCCMTLLNNQYPGNR